MDPDSSVQWSRVSDSPVPKSPRPKTRHESMNTGGTFRNPCRAREKDEIKRVDPSFLIWTGDLKIYNQDPGLKWCFWSGNVTLVSLGWRIVLWVLFLLTVIHLKVGLQTKDLCHFSRRNPLILSKVEFTDKVWRYCFLPYSHTQITLDTRSHTYTNTHTQNTHKYVFTRTHTLSYLHSPTYTLSHIQTYIWMYIVIQILTHILVCPHTYTFKHTSTHVHKDVHTHTRTIHVYIHMYTPIHVHIYTHVVTYTYVHVRVHIVKNPQDGKRGSMYTKRGTTIWGSLRERSIIKETCFIGVRHQIIASDFHIHLVKHCRKFSFNKIRLLMS